MSDRTCAGRCGRRLLTRKAWGAVRGTPEAAGFIKHGSRGMCDACVSWAMSTGRWEERVTTNVPLPLVLTDWQWLHEVGELDEELPLQERIRRAAPRMGMSTGALEKALWRAGVRNPVEPSDTFMKNRQSDCPGCKVRDHAVDVANAHLHHVAKALARRPDSTRLQTGLETAREDLAVAVAHREWHHSTEHDEAA